MTAKTLGMSTIEQFICAYHSIMSVMTCDIFNKVFKIKTQNPKFLKYANIEVVMLTDFRKIQLFMTNLEMRIVSHKMSI